MIILENTYAEITNGWYIDFIIRKEKTVEVYGPLATCEDVFCNNWVTRKSQKNVLVQDVHINNYSCMKGRKEEDGSLYRDCKLLLNEDQFEVVRVDCSVASISFFWIYIPLFSESVWFGTKMTRMTRLN